MRRLILAALSTKAPLLALEVNAGIGMRLARVAAVVASGRPGSSAFYSGGKRTVLLLFLAVTLGALPQFAIAQAAKKLSAASLEGSWSGGGTVTFASGEREHARCRARYSRAGKSSYSVSATCATASGRAAQTATVRQVGNDRYSGSFYNAEYSISGVISIVVHGSNQTVRLSSDSGSAILNLSR